jgi:hypothetical protein
VHGRRRFGLASALAGQQYVDEEDAPWLTIRLAIRLAQRATGR